MAALAIVGSHAINGVARIHSELIKRDLFKVKSSKWSSCPKSWLSNLIWIKRGLWDIFAGVPWHLAGEVPEQDQRHHPTKVLFRNKVIVIAESSFHFVLAFRWLLLINQGLTEAICDRIGHEWPYRLQQLEDLKQFADDRQFQAEILRVSYSWHCCKIFDWRFESVKYDQR